MDAELIKQIAVDVNKVASSAFQSGRECGVEPLQAKINLLEDELKASKDLCEKYRRIALERGPGI